MSSRLTLNRRFKGGLARTGGACWVATSAHAREVWDGVRGWGTVKHEVGPLRGVNGAAAGESIGDGAGELGWEALAALICLT